MNRETRRSYREKLEDSRWRDFCIIAFGQEKLLSNDPAVRTCEWCENTEKSEALQVHHLGYREGRDPWDYPLDEIAVICKPCHDEVHQFADELWNEILRCPNKWVIYEALKAARTAVSRSRAVYD